MRNLFSFTSFLSSLNESKLQTLSFEDLIKSRGGKDQDSFLPSNQFNNIEKVFGTSDYLTRFQIAQALKVLGREIFPNNSKFPNSETNKDLTSRDGVFMTFYIGDRNQNDKMDQISEDLLRAVKPVVDEMKKSPENLYTFFEPESSELPVVKKSKVNIGRIK